MCALGLAVCTGGKTNGLMRSKLFHLVGMFIEETVGRRLISCKMQP